MRFNGFTMAEILLSLTIIGVVAAITLPSLTGNINEKTWDAQRKSLYTRFSQALPLMPALNGYGSYEKVNSNGSTSIKDNCAETFITDGLSKVLKINNICDNEHLADCGIPASINTITGNKLSTPTTLSLLNSFLHGYGIPYNTKAAAFETTNGESIITYYNPACIGNLDEKPYTEESAAGAMFIQKRICANFIYDLNGNKGPNTVGKDIGFMTAMYPFDAKLYAPFPATKPLPQLYPAISPNGISAAQACTNYNKEYRLPRADELLSMFVNKQLIDGELYEVNEGWYTSSDFWFKSNGKYAMIQNLKNGQRDDHPVTAGDAVWCIKR